MIGIKRDFIIIPQHHHHKSIIITKASSSQKHHHHKSVVSEKLESSGRDGYAITLCCHTPWAVELDETSDLRGLFTKSMFPMTDI
jgi:hypothetical protein